MGVIFVNGEQRLVMSLRLPPCLLRANFQHRVEGPFFLYDRRVVLLE